MNQNKHKYIESIINAECDLLATFFGKRQKTPLPIGYITSLSFSDINKSLENDLALFNPEDPKNKQEAIAAVDRLCWAGGPCDLLYLDLRITFKNRAQIIESLVQLEEKVENPIIELEFKIFDYDWNTETYFKRLYTDKKLKFHIPKNHAVRFIETPANYPDGLPTNFSLSLELSPVITKDQEINFAFSSTGKQFKRIIGIPQSSE